MLLKSPFCTYAARFVSISDLYDRHPWMQEGEEVKVEVVYRLEVEKLQVEKERLSVEKERLKVGDILGDRGF